jgi:hypothetical protein
MPLIERRDIPSRKQGEGVARKIWEKQRTTQDQTGALWRNSRRRNWLNRIPAAVLLLRIRVGCPHEYAVQFFYCVPRLTESSPHENPRPAQVSPKRSEKANPFKEKKRRNEIISHRNQEINGVQF